jgi:hypothetical protein
MLQDRPHDAGHLVGERDGGALVTGRLAEAQRPRTKAIRLLLPALVP